MSDKNLKKAETKETPKPKIFGVEDVNEDLNIDEININEDKIISIQDVLRRIKASFFEYIEKLKLELRKNIKIFIRFMITAFICLSFLFLCRWVIKGIKEGKFKPEKQEIYVSDEVENFEDDYAPKENDGFIKNIIKSLFENK